MPLSEKAIKAALFTPGLYGRWGVPLVFTGEPGVGKTSILNHVCRSAGLEVTTIVASLREPSDFLGLPIPEEVSASEQLLFKDVKNKVVYSPAEWAVEAAKQKRGVVFFDEVNTAPPAVQAALLRVILEGAVGEFVLPPGIRFLAAMNDTKDAAGGWDLAAPLANRLGHIKWASPNADQWCDWLLGGIDDKVIITPGAAEAEENRVLAGWDKAFVMAKGLIASFMRRRPNLLMQMPESGNASKAWPSPRTWEMVTRAVASAELHGISEIDRDELISGFIGNGPMSELLEYMTNTDLPDPEDLLDGKIKFEHTPERLDRTSAILQSCAAYVAMPNCKKRDARASKLWNMLLDVQDAVDLVVPAARTMVRANLAGAKGAIDALERLQPILIAAGINR